MAVYAFSWYKARPSTGPLVLGYPEAAGETFVKGDPVKLDAAGRVLLAVDTEGDTVADLGGFFGFADGDASGTTDAEVKIILAQPTDIYAVSASAAGATRTVIRSDVGFQCSWIKSAVSGETTKSVIDVSDNTAKQLHFEILDTLDAVGTVDGRYLVRVSPTSYGIPRATATT